MVSSKHHMAKQPGPARYLNHPSAVSMWCQAIPHKPRPLHSTIYAVSQCMELIIPSRETGYHEPVVGLYYSGTPCTRRADALSLRTCGVAGIHPNQGLPPHPRQVNLTTSRVIPTVQVSTF